MQGVAELVECERCDDSWLREVHEELRHGRLSETNYNFLFGKPTKEPGRWCNGGVQCGNAARGAIGKRIQAHAERDDFVLSAEQERKRCKTCAAERQSKALVATGIQDSRFMDTKCVKAPAIFANNDIKYETKKLRAKHYAHHREETITYVCAKDMPTQDALRERPDLPSQKLAWLQRHDRESGNLYGVIPLIHGMPVALTEHIDRSPDKQLLRGKIGFIHGRCTSTRKVNLKMAYVCCNAKDSTYRIRAVFKCRWH
jgi:hypothetical protein